MTVWKTGTLVFCAISLSVLICAAVMADAPPDDMPGKSAVLTNRANMDRTEEHLNGVKENGSVPAPYVIPAQSGTVEVEMPSAGEELIPEERENNEETGDANSVDETQTGEEAVFDPAPGNGIGEEPPSFRFEDEEKKEEAQELLFVRELVGTESGYNDGNPVWSPDGSVIAFERGTKDRKKIVIATRDGIMIEKIYYQLSTADGEMDFFFPGISEDISYNSGISWSSTGYRFVFMSNGGGGNYDLYLRELGRKTTTRLTDNNEKDGQAQWSPTGDQIVFVSGRGGKGDLYIMDLTTKKERRITRGAKSYLYPQWSPDGKKISMIYGGNENHDIYVIRDLNRPFDSVHALTSWDRDDLRPVWSPDGSKIAFYSNYNKYDDPKIWSLIVIAANGDDPSGGDGLVEHVVARDVIPDIERGPAWMPDSNRIIYVKNDRHAYNPLYMVDVLKKRNVPLDTGTKMNHDVVCSREGTIAFRAQVQQWDHIYIAKLKEKP